MLNIRSQLDLVVIAAAGAARLVHREVGFPAETPGKRVRRVCILPAVALAANAANYAVITVTNDTRAKTIAMWSTLTGGAVDTGALAAGVKVVPVVQADTLFTAGDVLRVSVTHVGTGGAVDVAVIVHFDETNV